MDTEELRRRGGGACQALAAPRVRAAQEGLRSTSLACGEFGNGPAEICLHESVNTDPVRQELILCVVELDFGRRHKLRSCTYSDWSLQEPRRPNGSR
jgi:hypothetical protein